MEKHECLEQLKGLLENSKDMSQEEGDVWAKDVEALQMAIKSVAGVDMVAWNDRIIIEALKPNLPDLDFKKILVNCTHEVIKCTQAHTGAFGEYSGMCLLAAMKVMEKSVLKALTSDGESEEFYNAYADDLCHVFSFAAEEVIREVTP